MIFFFLEFLRKKCLQEVLHFSKIPQINENYNCIHLHSKFFFRKGMRLKNLESSIRPVSKLLIFHGKT